MTSLDALRELWRDAGMPEPALQHAAIHGQDPVLPSSFAVGQAAGVSIAAAGLAAAALWQLRTERWQDVSVELRHAAAEFRSDQYLKLDGRVASSGWDEIAGLYPTGDGWVRLHTNFPHHRAGVVKLLGGANTREAVASALLKWKAEAFQEAAVAAGLAVTALGRFESWDAGPQGRAVPQMPVVSITRLGDSPVEALPDSGRPLGGVRVVELVRVIAGPACGRALAAHGADVMNVTSPNLPSTRIEDLNRGKLSTQLDLTNGDARATLEGLVRHADVFVQGYRPGSIAGRGFGPAELAGMRPGIVVGSLSAYGPVGPWAGRRGFDSLVQTASGFNVAESEAAGQANPRPLPAQALDYATGYLLAFGLMTALHRRATQGGSWHVQVSLARTGLWLRGLGRVEGGFGITDQTPADLIDLLETTPSGFGAMTAVRHPAILSETPARWDRPSVPLGTHAPAWPRSGG